MKFTEIQICSNSLPTVFGPLILDAPVRAYVKRIVQHNAYHGCERCVQKGTWHGGHVTLLDVDADIRTDESFADNLDPSHHNSLSPFDDLNIGLVTDVVLDYMHLTTIGVMKLFVLWLLHNKKMPCQLGPSQREDMEKHIGLISKYLPSDFPRKLESGVKHIKRWKATEFRCFMLYVGIVAFANRKILSIEFYKHFLLLSRSMRILLNDNMTSNLSVVQDMLKSYVVSCPKLYGNSFVSYNVHSLIHLTADYAKFGNLEKISAFSFESYLGSNIKGAVEPLTSLYNKLLNMFCMSTIKQKRFLIQLLYKMIRQKCALVENCDKIEIFGSTFRSHCHARDSTVQLQNLSICQIAEIYNRAGEIYLKVKLYKKSSYSLSQWTLRM